MSAQSSGCPSCGANGKRVRPATVESLLKAEALARSSRTDGFRFCSTPSCDVVYFHPETSELFGRRDVRVRVGLKETAAPRQVCYCFDHTIEEIGEEVAASGTSRIPDEIAEMCRQGLDRCETTNPKGACCLGDVHKAVKKAQASPIEERT